MLLSLRAIAVGLVVVCVVVVGTVCTTVSVLSADRALSDTKAARDVSVRAAFSAGEAGVLQLSEDLLNVIGDSTLREMTKFCGIGRDTVLTVCMQMGAYPDHVVTSWDFLYRKRVEFYHLSKAFSQIDGMGVITTKYQVVQVIENSATLNKPAKDYHHFHMVYNNGTDHAGGADVVGRTLLTDMVPDGTADVYGMDDDSNVHRKDCVGRSAVLSDGAVLDAPCAYPYGDVKQMHYHYFNRTAMYRVYASPMDSFGRHVGTLIQCDYGSATTGERFGLIASGSDLRKVSVFLSGLHLGGEGRVFITVRRELFVGDTQFGYLAGTSHGSAFGHSNAHGVTVAVPMPATNCSDSIVAGTAHYLEQHDPDTNAPTYETLHKAGGPHRFTLMNETAAEERFFHASVKVFSNDMGIDWYIVSVIDEEYLLGDVLRATEETRRAVEASEAAVDGDLRRSRTMLFVVVPLAALVPILLAVVLVFRITASLIRLMHDMSLVAVMDLEHLNEPHFSIIAEIRHMETSFLRMVTNLTEYRQYLPQSVLVDTSTSNESSNGAPSAHIGSPDVDKQLARKDSAASVESMRVATVFGGAVSAKYVTLLVYNVHSVHSVADVPNLMLAYLEPFVQNVKKFRGIIDSVLGDHVTVAFNTAVVSASHKVNAVDCALYLQQHIAESFGAHRIHAQVNAAVASGKGVCGNMGCPGLKQYAIIGAVSCNVRALERSGREWGVPILCDGGVAKEASLRFVLRSITMACLKDRTETMLYEALAAKEVKNEEWMYQLEKAENADPYLKLNDALQSLFTGDTETAQKYLSECKSPGTDLARSMLERSMQTGSAPESVKLFNILPLLTPGSAGSVAEPSPMLLLQLPPSSAGGKQES